MIATGLASRLALPLLFPELRTLTALPISNFDALGLGSLLATWRRPGPGPRSRMGRLSLWGVPVFLALHAVVLAGVSAPPLYWARHTAMLVAFVWLVDSAAAGWTGRLSDALASRPIVYLGRISYGLYILHNLADIPLRALAQATGVRALETGMIGLMMRAALTVGGAALSWHVLENPLNRLKDRFPYRGRTGAGVQGAPAAALR
jgi:peptidoglycan/LPS O-acetylase OafA/YrhL